MDQLLLRVKKYMEKQGLLRKEASFVVGLSGGADSVCQLRMLSMLQKEYNLSLAALHVHHGIRGAEAEEDLIFSRELCGQWDIPFYEKRVDVPALAGEEGLTLEEAGRKIRYEALEELRQELQGDWISVAHHKDDQAETILHQMFRGSGLKGLGGIRPKNGRVARPLLCLTRKEIESWLKEQGISWKNDSTNRIPDVTRNKIRLELIPWLEEQLHPGVKETLVRNSENLAEIQDYLEEQTDQLKRQCVTRTDEGFLVDRKVFAKAHRAVQKELLYSCLAELAGTKKDIAAVHVQDCLELFDKQCGRKVMLPYELEAVSAYQGIYLTKNKKTKKENVFSMEQEEISLEDYKHFQENDYTKCFDYDRINCCLELRTRRPKDRICVFRDGRNKKLQDFFVDAKIPAEERDGISLLTEGDQILWVVGFRVSEAYKVTEETKRIMKVTLHPTR